MMLAFLLAASEPLLIGGSAVPAGKFPEIVYISNGESRCTATIVGPQVLLTAGHCTKDRGLISFSIDGKRYAATCRIHPKYAQTQLDDDVALCSSEVVLPVKPARVDLRKMSPGDPITLLGYGCINVGGGGGNDGVLRYGQAKVKTAATESYHWYESDAPTALCSGDSGGPNMFFDHVVVGVNSRGNLRNRSMFTSLFHTQDWIKNYAGKICGINIKCGEAQPSCVIERRFFDWYSAKTMEYRTRVNQCENP